MSYILDALRRAERERRRADSTVLETVTQVLAAPPPPAAAVALRRWVPGLLLAAVLLVGVVGGLLLRRPGTPVAPPSLTALKPTPEAAGSTPAAAPPPAVPSVAAGPAPVPAPAPPTLTTAESLNEVPPLPPAAVAPQPNEDEATLAAEAAPPDATAPDAVAPPEPVTRPILRQHLPSRSSEPAPRAASATARQLQQMPDSYRAHFPALAVDVHVYDDAPSRRFVIIGGRRYGEGETLNAGPRLVQIVPEGMVLDWQGQRVVYALAH